MAKRKRLTPARLDQTEPPARAPEVKAALGPGPAPIAQVAGAASTVAALDKLAAELRAAREGGRLVQALPLDAVEEGWLIRDRIRVDKAEMEDLVASIRERGQQTPIEVVALPDGRFGLISGWRRLQALRNLHQETGEPRFDTVQALLRRPESAADAYRAMVEENEIRVGLSYYERARIAAKSVEAGVHRTSRDAVAALFAAASRAKRSKIASFLAVHEALDGRLRFPAAIPERLGLALARAMEADAGLRERLRERLRKGAPESAEAEVALLERGLREKGAKPSLRAGSERIKGSAKGSAQGSGMAAYVDPPAHVDEVMPGIVLEIRGRRPMDIRLTGPNVNAALLERLRHWLRGGQRY